MYKYSGKISDKEKYTEMKLKLYYNSIIFFVLKILYKINY